MAFSDTWLKANNGKERAALEERGDREGLGVRVTPKGKITFQLRYRYQGAAKRLDLGSYPLMSLKEGELPVPRRPPSEPLHRPALRLSSSKRLQRVGVAIPTKGAFALLWTPSSKGLSRPLQPRPGAFVPLDPDRCFVTGFDQSGDFGSPFGNPSTSFPQFVGSVERVARNLRGAAGSRVPTVRSMARKKREAPVSYRPPAELRGEFDARVKNSRLSTNAFITASVFGQVAPRARRVSPLDQQMLAMLLSQAARISTHLGAAPTGSPLTQAAVMQCRDDLAVIRTVVMQVLRREP